MELSNEELRRYARNISIPEIGRKGQLRLKRSTVAIVGCGALGSVAASYLAASGIGNIRLVDFDTIDLSNLQRQVFFDTPSTGRKKAEVMAERISRLNPEINVGVFDMLLCDKNIKTLLAGSDFVIDATDNPASKSLIDNTCGRLGIPRVMAGVSGFRGLVTTCDGLSANFADLFPDASDAGVAPCSIAGVAGPAAGVAACIQAAEAIKYIAGINSGLRGRMLAFDLLEPSFRIISL